VDVRIPDSRRIGKIFNLKSKIMENSKLSLDAFKEMASSTDEKLLLEQVQGGSFDDCHGFLGMVGKMIEANGPLLPILH